MENEDRELELIRKKKMAQLQDDRMREEAVAKEQARVDEQKKAILLRIMTPDAKERLNRVKLAYPELGANVENQLIMLYGSGRLQGGINDEQLKKILKQLQPKSNKEIRIVRK